MIIFEDRSSYDPDKDAVCVIGLEIECNPGQKNAIIDSLNAVTRQAGVYSVDIDSADVPVSTAPAALSAPPFSEEPLGAVEPEVENIEGVEHAEPTLQPASVEPKAVESIGDAAAEGAEELRPADENSELGRIAGAEPEEGSRKRRT